MKKFLKILIIVIISLLVIMIIVPYLFKDTILEKAEKQLNNSLEANVVVGDVNLSMFADFPNLYVELENITVVGKNEFANDTLANISRFYTGVNLISAIFGDEISVGVVVIESAKIKALVLKNEKANWDIAKKEETAESQTEKEGGASDFNIKFEEVKLEDIFLIYDDASQNIRLKADSLNLILSGNFSAQNTNINLVTEIASFDFEYEDTKYIKEAQFGLEAVIAADLENMTFAVKDNKLTINDLEFGVDGSFGIKDDAYVMDMKLDARKTDFKTLLSMIPDVFKTDLKGLETSGKLNFNAYVKGEYRDDYLPSFGVNLKVEDARFKYPDLPESVENIKIDAQIYNPGGDADNTVIDLNSFHLEVAKNPFDAKIHIKTPISDPEITGEIKGVIDFAKVRSAIRIDDVSIVGQVIADVSFNGKMSSIEKKRYEEFMAKGDIKLKNILFTTPDFPQGVKILNSVLSFTPQHINIASFDSYIGKSDLKLTGKISNYIPYILKDKTLSGNFNLNSNWLNLNEFMEKESGVQEKENADTIPLSIVEVPANLNIKLVSNLKKIRVDKMDIENVTGIIEVKNSIAQLINLKMNMLKGSVMMNGSYNTQNIKKPLTDFDMDVKNFDIKSAYQTLSTVKEMIPIALNCEGKVSADLAIASELDKEMNPIAKTINGKGSFHSEKIIISDNQAFNTFADLMKNDSYKRISISKFDMQFVIKNGNINVPPFKTKVANHEAVIYGTQSVEGKLDFTMEMKIPKEELGREVNKYFDKLPGYDNIPALDVAVKITGDVSNPKVKLDLSKAIKQARRAVENELKNRAKDELKNQLKKLFN